MVRSLSFGEVSSPSMQIINATNAMTARLSGELTDRKKKDLGKVFNENNYAQPERKLQQNTKGILLEESVSYLDSPLTTSQAPSLGPPLDLLLVSST